MVVDSFTDDSIKLFRLFTKKKYCSFWKVYFKHRVWFWRQQTCHWHFYLVFLISAIHVWQTHGMYTNSDVSFNFPLNQCRNFYFYRHFASNRTTEFPWCIRCICGSCFIHIWYFVFSFLSSILDRISVHNVVMRNLW